MYHNQHTLSYCSSSCIAIPLQRIKFVLNGTTTVVPWSIDTMIPIKYCNTLQLASIFLRRSHDLLLPNWHEWAIALNVEKCTKLNIYILAASKVKFHWHEHCCAVSTMIHPRVFHCLKLNLCTYWTFFLLSLFLATFILFSICMNVMIPYTSPKWNDAIYTLCDQITSCRAMFQRSVN